MRLAEVEARFYALVTAPESVAATVAKAGGEAAREVEALVVGDGRLAAVERLDVYANMYFFRIRDVLKDEYPRTVTSIGADGFHNLVTDYLAAVPPSHPSLREAGAGLPAFLAVHPLGLERPWLAEMARLERARLELVDGPDAPALSLETLRETPAERFGAIPLRLIPCHALLANHHAVAPLWRAAAAASGAPDARDETLLVWRRDLEVFHRAVDAEEADCLRRLAPPGLSFEALCAKLVVGRADEAAAARAFELVARWAADGLLRATD